MLNRKLQSLILAGLIVAIIAMIPVTPVNALEMEYFPLAPGGYLIYNTTSDNGDWMTKRYVAPEWEFIGGPFGTFAVLWSEAHMNINDTDYAWVNHMWISKTDDTLLWWGFEDANAKIVCYSPIDYVTEPVVEGAIQGGATAGTLILKADGTSIPDVPFSANYTIEAIEDVTTPAGTFEDCIRLHEEEITPDGEISFWVWYAPNVGAIQYYYPNDGERWDVLLEYEIDVNNDPWNTWLLPKVPMLLSILTVVTVIAVVLVIFVIRRRRS